MHQRAHSLGAALKQSVKLGAILDDLPGPLEACRNHEPIPGRELPALTVLVLQRDASASQTAELRLAVADAPFAARTRPASAVELLGLIGEVVGDHLVGRAFEQAVCGGRGGLTILAHAEIDDVHA